MNSFLRAAELRSLSEHETRLVKASAKALPDAPEPRVKGRCACGEVVLLGRGECRGCSEALPVEARAWRWTDVVAVVARVGEATAEDVATALGCSAHAAQKALGRCVRRGVLVRVRFGEYAVKDETP